MCSRASTNSQPEQTFEVVRPSTQKEPTWTYVPDHSHRAYLTHDKAATVIQTMEQADRRAKVIQLGDVSTQTAQHVMGFIGQAISKDGATAILLLISSNGGDLGAAITLFNYLQGLTIKVHTHNLGRVSSAAVPVYLGGTIRTAEDYSTFLIHPVRFQAGQPLTTQELSEHIGAIDANEKILRRILLGNTSLSAEDVDRYIAKGITLTSAEALAKGIATAVKSVSYPPNPHIATIS